MTVTDSTQQFERAIAPDRDPMMRILDWSEIRGQLSDEELGQQGARCFDCGVPFCHSGAEISNMAMGCPLNNHIPEWNGMVHKQQWRDALTRLLDTNNFPEFTGRTCPAPCEGSCVMGITESPVTIKNIELAIIDRGFEEGWITSSTPTTRTGKNVAIVGSGPAGLAAADQLNAQGHQVTVFERADRIGGLLMYGIPNMKLDKTVVERRVNLMRESGIEFVCNTEIGADISASELQGRYDAIVLCTGSTRPRDLTIPGRESTGIHFALDFLRAKTQNFLDGETDSRDRFSAKNKRVMVIGGGDTGTDCIASAMREGCRSVTNLEIVPQPPAARAASNPWPEWPKVFRVDYGHAEAKAVFGADPRQFSTMTLEFTADTQGHVHGVKVCEANWSKDENGRHRVNPVPRTERIIRSDMILLALGFEGPESPVAQQLGVNLNERTNFWTEKKSYRTNVAGVFAAGDCRRGQSLVVWAIAEGRKAAAECDRYLSQSKTATRHRL